MGQPRVAARGAALDSMETRGPVGLDPTRIVRLGDRRVAAALEEGILGAVLDARALRAPWSVGDWGLARARGASAVAIDLEDVAPEGHDLARGAGSHAISVATLRDAVAAGLAVLVLTEITRSSARSALAVQSALARAGAAAWHVSLVAPRDPARAASLLPSLGVAMPHVLRAIDAADRGGLAVVLAGFPRCVLGPFARWQAAVEGTARGAPCDGCAARRGCPGLGPEHRARFGARELRPLDDDRSPARGGLEAVFDALRAKSTEVL